MSGCGRCCSILPTRRPPPSCSGIALSIAQARRLRARLATALGEQIEVDGAIFAAFPSPARLLEARELPGVSAIKAERLRAVAAAAASGTLDRAHLRALSEEDALRELQRLPGIGPFFAQGILKRGAGVVDSISHDPVSLGALAALYGSEAQLEHVAEPWRPFRMWANVLLHVWASDAGGLRSRRDQAPPERIAGMSERQLRRKTGPRDAHAA